MNLTPLLLCAHASAQEQPLASKAFRMEELPVREGAHMSSRAILHGRTNGNILLDLHETELAAGEAPHPPHRHVHEELLMVRSGVLDVTVSGRTTRLGPGSVAYLASNEWHGWRNPGTVIAEYFVLALGEDA